MGQLTQAARQMRRNSTDAEGELWAKLRAHRLGGYSFKRQQPIGPYIVDFVCKRRGLVIELDGGCHEAAQEYDDVRTKYLEARGYRVLRFSNQGVRSRMDTVLRVILRELLQ